MILDADRPGLDHGERPRPARADKKSWFVLAELEALSGAEGQSALRLRLMGYAVTSRSELHRDMACPGGVLNPTVEGLEEPGFARGYAVAGFVLD